jgi:hypothetical protein
MIRRIALGTIALAAIVTAALGAVSVAAGISSVADMTVWASLFIVAGLFALGAGAYCADLAGRDIAPARLSADARRWTWAATAALASLMLVSVWFFYLALLCPLVTAAAVRAASYRIDR